MIEIYLLEQLDAFARWGTLSAAAEKLNLSQPSLPCSMKKLEEQVGVPLFERGKNKLTLNANGKLAAEYARRVLEQDRELTERVRAFNRANRTIEIGACAPVPLARLIPQITSLYADMTISQEVRPDKPLLEGLREDVYQLVILHEKPEDSSLFWLPFGEEKLYLVLPKTHPLADREGLWFRDLEGMSILLYAHIGFWYELCLEKIPNPNFLLQHDFQAFGTLIQASDLPVFTSSHYLQAAPNPDLRPRLERIVIPILDSEAHVRYALVCKEQDRERFQPLFRQLSE